MKNLKYEMIKMFTKQMKTNKAKILKEEQIEK